MAPSPPRLLSLTDLIRILAAKLPVDEDSSDEPLAMPRVIAETLHRQFAVMGIRINNEGHAVLQLKEIA